MGMVIAAMDMGQGWCDRAGCFGGQGGRTKQPGQMRYIPGTDSYVIIILPALIKGSR